MKIDSSRLVPKVWLLVASGLFLEAAYLFVVECFTDQATGVPMESIADNLAFFGPMIEFLIGGCFLAALFAAFVLSLGEDGDISMLLGIVLVVPSCSVGIAAIAPYFCQMVATEAITFGMGASMASEGLTMATLAYALSGMSAAIGVALYYQVVIVFMMTFSLLLRLKMFVPAQWW